MGKHGGEGSPAGSGRQRRRERKSVPRGMAHIRATFNNTMVTITDPNGNALSWSSAGAQNFKGSRKSTPYAAQVTADIAARKAMEHGVRQIEVYVRGPGSGREAAIRALAQAGHAGGLDHRRDADPAQWVPPAEATPRLAFSTFGDGARLRGEGPPHVLGGTSGGGVAQAVPAWHSESRAPGVKSYRNHLTTEARRRLT